MIHRFDLYELDTDKGELRCGAQIVPVEPQVFALLLFLIENRERLVSKDEIVESVWAGRIVSDSAISSRIKSARQAIGDDGKAQRMIRTLHGSGFRFIAEVTSDEAAPAAQAKREKELEQQPEEPTRPSIAVLPFTLVGDMGRYGPLADALPHDLITELSRLRWLFVIARGSSFQFRGPDVSAERVGAALGVRYCLTGAIETGAERIAVSVELIRTQDNLHLVRALRRLGGPGA